MAGGGMAVGISLVSVDRLLDELASHSAFSNLKDGEPRRLSILLVRLADPCPDLLQTSCATLARKSASFTTSTSAPLSHLSAFLS